LQSTSDGTAFDVFYVLDEANQPVGANSALSAKIVNTLHEAIINPQTVDFDIQRRTPRQLKNFALKTVASLRNDSETATTVLEIITPDRPGLLAHLARIFVRFELRILNAKISTLGERVEDIFYITDRALKPITNAGLIKTLKEIICTELDERNQEDGKEYKLRKMKVWQ
jgi:[protein-PII] uridylyltransferase